MVRDGNCFHDSIGVHTPHWMTWIGQKIVDNKQRPVQTLNPLKATMQAEPRIMSELWGKGCRHGKAVFDPTQSLQKALVYRWASRRPERLASLRASVGINSLRMSYNATVSKHTGPTSASSCRYADCKAWDSCQHPSISKYPSSSSARPVWRRSSCTA